ncbi:MAG: GlcG/HbpS family heme-binding protein [Burkholderiaceae bacterium]
MSIIPSYGPAVTLEQAKRIMAAAEHEARAQGWPMVIAIVDNAGLPLLFERMDDAQLGSVEVALGKAKTAALFRRSSKVFEDIIGGGGAGLRILSMPQVVPLEGGLPILHHGKVIGGIGVSGMASNQDAQVAQAGLKALDD